VRTVEVRSGPDSCVVDRRVGEPADGRRGGGDRLRLRPKY